MSSKTRTRVTSTTGSLRSVADQAADAKIRTEDKLWKALHANPNSTAADLSSAAKIGKSTAQKILTRWASGGTATRTAGIAEGGRRAPDLWAITADAVGIRAADTDSNTAQADQDTPGMSDTGDALHTDGNPSETTSTEPIEPAEVEPIVTEATNPGDNAAAPDDDTASDDDKAADGDLATEGGRDEKPARLAPGTLRGMVEDYLRDHPGEEFGPTAIAKALGGKSSGAVSNALDKLAEDKTAVQTKNKPRRFALAPTGQAAPSTTETN